MHDNSTMSWPLRLEIGLGLDGTHCELESRPSGSVHRSGLNSQNPLMQLNQSMANGKSVLGQQC